MIACVKKSFSLFGILALSITTPITLSAVIEPAEDFELNHVNKAFDQETAPFIVKVRQFFRFSKNSISANQSPDITHLDPKTNSLSTKKHSTIFGNTLGKISLIIGAILMISYLRALNEA